MLRQCMAVVVTVTVCWRQGGRRQGGLALQVLSEAKGGQAGKHVSPRVAGHVLRHCPAPNVLRSGGGSAQRWEHTGAPSIQ